MADTDEERQAEWNSGFHTAIRDGKEITLKLDAMDYEHLVRTINAFPHLDVKPLQKALRDKQQELIPIIIGFLEYREGREAKKDTKRSRRRGRRARQAREALQKFVDVT